VSLSRDLLRAIALDVRRRGGGPDDAVALADVWRRLDRELDARAAAVAQQAQTVRCACATPAEAAPDGRCSRCWGWPPGVAPIARPAPAPAPAETRATLRLPPLRPAPRTAAETWRALRAGYDWQAIGAARQREAA
jgi:hypothetical protein